MPLTLRTGPPAALELALVEAVRARKAHDPLAPVHVLVGGTLQKPFLRRLLADALGGHVNVHVVTPGELGVALGERPHVLDGRRPLPALGDRAIAHHVAQQAEGYFEPVRETPGLGEALHRLDRELRQAAVQPVELAAAAPTEVSERKHAALAELLGAVHGRRQGFYSADDCLAEAEPARLDTTELLVHGLWEPSVLVRRLLRALAERLPVTVLLPAIHADADEVHAPFRSWLERNGAAAHFLPAPEPQGYGTSALAHLKTHLFTHAREADADDTAVLVSAPDPAREVREAARSCLRWAEQGIAFHEMAVAFRHADAYRGLIESAFREVGIPLYLHEGAPLSERPLGRRMIALLELVGAGLPRREVMDFLTDTWLPEATRERFGTTSSARWDHLSRRAGIVEGREQWLSRLALLAGDERRALAEDPDQPWREERIEAIKGLRGLVEALDDRLTGHPDVAPWSAHMRWLREACGELIAGADPALGALDALAELDAVVPEVGFERFRTTVVASIESLRAADVFGDREGAFALRGVNVLDVSSLRHLRFRAVHVLGLAERSFPPPPRQDALLLDEERIALNEAMGWELPLRARGGDPEPLQFALALHAAGERLALSYPRSDGGKGRAQLPSSFFRAAASALAGTRVKASEIDRLTASGHLRRVAAEAIGAPAVDVALTPVERDRTLLVTNPTLGLALMRRRHASIGRAQEANAARFVATELTPFDGVLRGDGARAALAEHRALERAFSTTRLEDYATCPHRFFLNTVLGLKDVEEPEAVTRIDALARGNLIHGVLQAFLAEQEGPLTGSRAERDRLRQLAEAACAEAEARGVTGFPALWEIDRRQILDDVMRWLEHELDDPDNAFPEHAYELRFGPTWAAAGPDDPRSRDEPVELGFDGEQIRLQGRIDRVDFRPGPGGRMRVIDYKTGRSDDYKAGSIEDGRALQLPLYLLAAAQLLGVPAERSEAQYFFVTRRGGFKRVAFTGDDLVAQRAELDQVMSRIAQGLRDGDFHLDPGRNGDHCRRCDFATVCHTQRVAIAERKQRHRAEAHGA